MNQSSFHRTLRLCDEESPSVDDAWDEPWQQRALGNVLCGDHCCFVWRGPRQVLGTSDPGRPRRVPRGRRALSSLWVWGEGCPPNRLAGHPSATAGTSPWGASGQEAGAPLGQHSLELLEPSSQHSRPPGRGCCPRETSA